MLTPRVEDALRSFEPALAWLPRYGRKWLQPDAIAGLTLWGLSVPEAMADAGVAGLPPEAGLYLVARKLQAVRTLSRTEFWLGVLIFAGVVIIDVLPGMVIGGVASLLLVIYRSSQPHLPILGRVPGVSGKYADLARHPEAVRVPGVLVIRFDAPIYYANALSVRGRIEEIVEATSGLLAALGPERVFATVDAAVDGLARGPETLFSSAAPPTAAPR